MSYRSYRVLMYLCFPIALQTLLLGCVDGSGGDPTVAAAQADGLQSTAAPGTTLSANACSIVQSVGNGGANPVFQINPRSATVSDFTRIIYPRLDRTGSWSASQFVSDGQGLILPAIVANGMAQGMMLLPFESGETIVGVAVTVCTDATTTLISNLFASQFTNEQRTNWTDGLVSVGGIAQSGNAAQWRDVDLGMLPTVLTTQSALWLTLTATQSTAPPSMAVSRIVLYMNH